MARPFCCRRIEGRPAASVFKPAGIPVREAGEVVMTLDEFEAVRLADLEGMYQELAAAKMGVSRSTFSRIVDAAHRKIAEAIVYGKALKIEGGPVFDSVRRRCEDCSCEWEGPPECPRCKGTREIPAMEDGTHRRRCGRRRRAGCEKTVSGALPPGKGEAG